MRLGFVSLMAVAVAAVLLLTGCASEQLAGGRYEIDKSGRGDFAVVYGDMIFFRLKSPADAPGKLSYWEWAGKYSLDENGELWFDMDTKTEKRWKFYYQLIRKRDGILVNDLSENTGFMLKYEPPKLRSGNFGPQPVGTGGVDPVYRDFNAR